MEETLINACRLDLERARDEVIDERLDSVGYAAHSRMSSLEIDRAIYKSVQGLGHSRYSFNEMITENRPRYDLILRELLTHLVELNNQEWNQEWNQAWTQAWTQAWNLVQIKIKTSNIKYREMYALHNNNTDDIIIVVDSTKKHKTEPKGIRKNRTHCWRKEANGTYSIAEQHSDANRIMIEMPTVKQFDVYNIPTILWYELVEGFGPPRIKRFGTKLNARTSNGINEYIFR
jgi:hypothetical protein